LRKCSRTNAANSSRASNVRGVRTKIPGPFTARSVVTHAVFPDPSSRPASLRVSCERMPCGHSS
jgi:hypothetical protein